MNDRPRPESMTYASDEDFLTMLEREEQSEEKRTAPGRPSVMPSWGVDDPGSRERVERGAEIVEAVGRRDGDRLIKAPQVPGAPILEHRHAKVDDILTHKMADRVWQIPSLRYDKHTM
jgi:hypothetical protein